MLMSITLRDPNATITVALKRQAKPTTAAWTFGTAQMRNTLPALRMEPVTGGERCKKFFVRSIDPVRYVGWSYGLVATPSHGKGSVYTTNIYPEERIQWTPSNLTTLGLVLIRRIRQYIGTFLKWPVYRWPHFRDKFTAQKGITYTPVSFHLQWVSAKCLQ